MAQTIRFTIVTSLVSPPTRIQTTDGHVAMNSSANLINAANSGARVTPGSFTSWIDSGSTYASGQVTCVTVANNSTVTIGTVVLTGKTSAPSGTSQWLCGVSATADAIALKNCINANASLSPYFLATNPSVGVVTITAIGNVLGVVGNFVILASSDGTNLPVVAFTSGVNDTGVKTYSF